MQNFLSDEDRNAINELLAEELDVPQDEIAPEARIVEDFAPDSLARAEIAMKLEDRFNVSLPDGKWEAIRTVQDIYDLMAELLAERNKDSP